MVNQILLTYNPSKVMAGVTASGDMSYYFLAASLNELLNINKVFRIALDNEGVLVKEIQHDKGLDSIIKQITSAEFIWHDFNLLYRQLGTEFRKDRNAQLKKVQDICEIIKKCGKLPKSHGIRDFLNSFDKVQVVRYLAEKEIPVPKTQEVDEYLLGEKKVPIVLKFNTGTRGSNIFFVESIDQLVKYFDRDFYREGIRQSLNVDLNQYDNTLPDKDDYHISEFIDSPSDHYTHFRILTFRDQILGAVLNYSSNKKSDETRIDEPYGKGIPGYIPNWTTSKESPMYLGWKSIISNHAAGATQIPITITSESKKITSYEQVILESHGINPSKPELPLRLYNFAKKVGIIFSKQGTSYLGQDWIMDKNGNFYCLEVNDWSGMDAFNVTHNHGNTDEREGVRVGYQILAKAIKNYQPE